VNLSEVVIDEIKGRGEVVVIIQTDPLPNRGGGNRGLLLSIKKWYKHTDWP
jgi:hypothetical protein